MKRHTFRICYRPTRRAPYQTRLLSAYNTKEAIGQLNGYWTIRSITVQCEGVTKSDHACQRFSHDFYCNAHKYQE